MADSFKIYLAPVLYRYVQHSKYTLKAVSSKVTHVCCTTWKERKTKRARDTTHLYSMLAPSRRVSSDLNLLCDPSNAKEGRFCSRCFVFRSVFVLALHVDILSSTDFPLQFSEVSPPYDNSRGPFVSSLVRSGFLGPFPRKDMPSAEQKTSCTFRSSRHRRGLFHRCRIFDVTPMNADVVRGPFSRPHTKGRRFFHRCLNFSLPSLQ